MREWGSFVVRLTRRLVARRRAVTDGHQNALSITDPVEQLLCATGSFSSDLVPIHEILRFYFISRRVLGEFLSVLTSHQSPGWQVQT